MQISEKSSESEAINEKENPLSDVEANVSEQEVKCSSSEVLPEDNTKSDIMIEHPVDESEIIGKLPHTCLSCLHVSTYSSLISAVPIPEIKSQDLEKSDTVLQHESGECLFSDLPDEPQANVPLPSS